MEDRKRVLICSPYLYDMLRKRFPNRKIEYSIFCEYENVYWFGNANRVRCWQPEDGKIMILDYDRGFPWMKLRRTVNPIIRESK